MDEARHRCPGESRDLLCNRTSGGSIDPGFSPGKPFEICALRSFSWRETAVIKLIDDLPRSVVGAAVKEPGH
jgi:hypothetical protein